MRQDLMTMNEVCEEYRITRQWLHYLRKYKGLKSYSPKAGRRVYFKRTEVESFFLNPQTNLQ